MQAGGWPTLPLYRCKRRVANPPARHRILLQARLKLAGVPIDENEGVVKRHLFAAMLCSTAWISEKVEDRSSESLAVNQFSAVVPPTIDSVSTSTMILLCEPRSKPGRERPINSAV